MKRSDAFPSQYLGKDDLPAPKVLTIADVQMATLKGDNGDEQKPAMYFNDFPKPFLLNNGNWMTIEDAYGDDSDLWRGKRVELFVDPSVMFGNKRVGGVRVRIPQNGRTLPPAAPTEAAWSWDMAMTRAAAAGIDKPALVELLKQQGNTGWNPQRDTPLVQQWIKDATARAVADAPFSGEAEFKEEDIPF